MKKETDGQKLKIHFLGGVGEIGKNCTALEFGQDIIVIDAGLTFPDYEMPGIDLVIPDFSYLADNKDRIKGFVITHGHEDHIGGLPFILKEMKIPVYATKLTLMLLEYKLRERNINDAELNCVKEGDTVVLGSSFKVEFIHVNHSISGSCALSITTPVGVVFHSGDFKIDYTPVDGGVADLARIAEIGKKGVQLLLCESTNIEKSGSSLSESRVGTSLDGLFSENATRRLIIATFSSNVHRIQQIIDLAAKYKRKVALSGRSMLNVADAATRIGELRIDKGSLIQIDKIDKVADKDLVIISTGSQGEPMSALTRMASGDFNKVKIGSNDTIIISATPIPGNEKGVYRVINNLYKLGAEVVYSSLAEIHASGHACQDEIKLIHQLVSPKYFIPVHGEYRHLIKHRDLAVQLGMPKQNTLIAEIGDTIELTRRSMTRSGSVQAGTVLVDGLGFGEVGSMLLRDRKQLAEDGLIIVVATISDMSGELLRDVDVIPRGIVLAGEPNKTLDEAKRQIMTLVKGSDLKSYASRELFKENVRKQMRAYFFKTVMQRPMIIPIINEI